MRTDSEALLAADEKADKHNIVQFFKQFTGYIPEYGITQDLEN
jgi:hypothetical protein